MTNPTKTTPIEGYTLIPITDDMIKNPEQSAWVAIHNLWHLTRYHGVDVKKLHPKVFTPSVPTPSGHTNDTIKQSVQVAIHNLRHIAKYHGLDVKKLHPEVFTPSAPASSSQISPAVNAPAPAHTKISLTAQTQASLDDINMMIDGDKVDTEVGSGQQCCQALWVQHLPRFRIPPRDFEQMLNATFTA